MNCDSIASSYRWIEYAVFGPYLERARFHWIDDLADAKNVLILGDGDGRFLARYAAANPGARIDSVDLSGRMLQLSERRLTKLGAGSRRGIRLIYADALSTDRLDGPYDLVIANFFLDCLDHAEHDRLIRNLAGEMALEARWQVTDFRIPAAPKRAWVFLMLTKIMYFFFHALTGLQNRELVDFSPNLIRAGFYRVRQRTWLFGYLFSDVWER